MPSFSLQTFANPRSNLITAHTISPFPFPSLCPAECTPYPLYLFFFSCCDALHLALDMVCPSGFVSSISLLNWPFRCPRYTHPCTHTHTHLQSHMPMDILQSLPMDLIFITAQKKKKPSIVVYTVTFKVVLFIY